MLIVLHCVTQISCANCCVNSVTQVSVVLIVLHRSHANCCVNSVTQVSVVLIVLHRSHANCCVNSVTQVSCVNSVTLCYAGLMLLSPLLVTSLTHNLLNTMLTA